MAWSVRLGIFVAAALAAAVGANGCSSGGAGTPDAGDASNDSKPIPKDSGGNETGICGAVACEVCDTSGYSTTPMTAPAAHAGACTAGQISAFVTACGATGTQTTCDAWQTAESTSEAGPGCLDCVFSDQSASPWGVYVCGSTSCSLNSPGCVDIALGQLSQEKAASGAGSCGDLVSDSYGCQDYACGSCNTNDYDTCTTNALAHECSAYDAKVQSSTGPCAGLGGDGGVDGGPDPNICFGATDNDLGAMTTLLCGAP